MKNQRLIPMTFLTAAMGLASVGALAQNPTNPALNAAEPVSRAAVRAEAQSANRAKTIPSGEASTLVNQQPNASPQPTGELSRAEVKAGAQHSKRPFGNPGERPAVVTNPTDSTGTPK